MILGIAALAAVVIFSMAVYAARVNERRLIRRSVNESLDHMQSAYDRIRGS